MGAAFSSTDQEDTGMIPYVGGGPDGEVITQFTCCFKRHSGVDRRTATRHALEPCKPITTWEQIPDDFNDPIFSDYNAATIDGRTSPLHWA